MAYSLWLTPERRRARELQRAIDRLARRTGGHRFAPHLTVSSGLSQLPSGEALEQLAARHRKPTLATVRIEHSRQHYRCLSLRVRDDRALNKLRADALASLGGSDSVAPYKPHISLLYAKLNAARRERLLKSIPAELLGRCRGSHLQLVLTEGDERRWRVLEQLELDNP